MRFTPNDNSTDISGLRFPQSAMSSTAHLLKSTGRALGDAACSLVDGESVLAVGLVDESSGALS